jgi:hypothetical protein
MHVHCLKGGFFKLSQANSTNFSSDEWIAKTELEGKTDLYQALDPKVEHVFQQCP